LLLGDAPFFLFFLFFLLFDLVGVSTFDSFPLLLDIGLFKLFFTALLFNTDFNGLPIGTGASIKLVIFCF